MFPYENGFDTVIPLSLTEKSGKRLIICCEEAFEAAVKAENLASETVFSAEGVKYLTRLLSPLFDKYGYRAGDDSGIYNILTFTGTVPNGVILPSTKRLSDIVYDENLTSYLPDPFDPTLKAYGTVINGALVSVCSEAPPEYDPTGCDPFADCVETGVETAETHAGQGYAASNIAALAEELYKSGKTAVHICAESNKGSYRAALKAGFTESGKRLYITAEKMTE